MTLLPLPNGSKTFHQCQYITAIPVFINNIIHGLFHHEDSQSADVPFLSGKGGVCIRLGQGIKGLAAV